jgi:hypothetical protein
MSDFGTNSTVRMQPTALRFEVEAGDQSVVGEQPSQQAVPEQSAVFEMTGTTYIQPSPRLVFIPAGLTQINRVVELLILARRRR